MSALTTRDALAKALHELFGTWVYGQDIGPWDGERVEAEHPRWLAAADALIASGAVIDAGTLADDEAIHERLWGVLDDHGHNGIDCRPAKPMDMTVEAMLRDLAAALTERAS